MRRRRKMSESAKQRLSEMAKARWLGLSEEERAARYRRTMASMMVSRPDIAIFPERWMAESMRGDA